MGCYDALSFIDRGANAIAVGVELTLSSDLVVWSVKPLVSPGV